MSTKMNISLPAPMKKWVERHATAKGETTDALVLEMLRREKAQAARERIDDLLSDAISSGEPRPMTAKDWERIRAAGMKRVRERQGSEVI